jgi:tyrosine-protein phosphatase SIW14
VSTKRLFTTVLLAILTIAVPAFAQNEANIKFSGLRLKNFGRISDSYYRGAQPVGQDYTDLAKLGVKTVINLIGDEPDPNEKNMVEKAGMKYFAIPMTTHQSPTAEKLSDFLRIVNDSANQPVYVHCIGGKHRTGVMTAVYRMTHDLWTADQAFAEMKQYNYGPVFLHPEFKQFVYDFYKKLAIPSVPAVTATTAVAATN